jgi:hypothetical protein
MTNKNLIFSPNQQGILLPQAVHTELSIISSDQFNYSWRGVVLIVTAADWVSGSYTPTLQAKDPATDTYYDLLSAPSLDCNCINQMVIYPGIAENGGISVNTILPYIWRVKLVSEDTPNMKISIGYSLIN